MRRLLPLAAVAVLALVAARAALADRLALWTIVHAQCAPAAEAHAALPPPCLDVEVQSATIKDRNGVAQVLTIPTRRITGVEDPALLADDAPPIFADAFAARGLMRKYLASAPDGVGLALAVNSAEERSQDQLHVHVDCLKPEVAKALEGFEPTADWQQMGQPLAGHVYFARALPDLNVNPFRLVAQLPDARTQMGEWTLAVVPRPTGFVLLAGRHGGPGGGHAEDIQDNTCALAH